MIKQILLQLVLILLNAFFAATEIAVISLNEKKIKAKADDGDKKAIKMLKMIDAPTRFLSTIQIGITLAGFLGSAFAADNFAKKLSDIISAAFNVPAENSEIINTAAVIVITLYYHFSRLFWESLFQNELQCVTKKNLQSWYVAAYRLWQPY